MQSLTAILVVLLRKLITGTNFSPSFLARLMHKTFALNKRANLALCLYVYDQ